MDHRVIYCLVPDFAIDIAARTAGYICRLLRPGSEGIVEGRVRGAVIGPRHGGKQTLIGRHAIIEGWDRVEFGRNVRIHNSVQLTTGRSGYLKIGDDSHVARLTVIAAVGGVTIGNHCAISSGVSIFSVSQHKPSASKNGSIPSYSAPVTIGDRVLIGCNASILPGVKIGDNATIAAGAVVSSDVAENQTVAGVPARTVEG